MVGVGKIYILFRQHQNVIHENALFDVETELFCKYFN